MGPVTDGLERSTCGGSHAAGLSGSLRPVSGLVGKDPADPAGRFGDISPVTRNEVEMRMGHGLPCQLAAIDSEVHSVKSQFPG